MLCNMRLPLAKKRCLHVLQGVDVSHEISRYGIWQPNNILGWPPALVEEFLAGLPRRAGVQAVMPARLGS